MRARTPRRAAWLVAVAAFAAAALVGVGASANHAPPPPTPETHIGQAGRGGDSLPVIEGMSVQAVLFDPKRFPINLQPGEAARPGFQRYLAFGLVRVPGPPELGELISQLAVSKSENGLDWTTPQRATIRDPNGVDVPFILNEPDGFFDVAFITAFTDGPFSIYYRILDGDISDVESIHVAFSDDAATWYLDAPISQAGEDLVTGVPGSFKFGSHGPTDVVYQPTKSNVDTCATVDPDGAGPLLPTPWNCRYVMLYEVVSDAGIRQVGIASSHNGFEWRGFIDPVTLLPRPLVPAGGAGAWDDAAVTLASIRIRPNAVTPSQPTYDLYYSGGGDVALGCFAASAPCWSLGTASSAGLTQGLTYTKTAGNPVTPASLLELFGPDDPHTLFKPVVVDDASPVNGNGGGHASIYYTRITNGNGVNPLTAARDAYLAFAEPAPEQKPRIRIASPLGPFRNRADTPLEFYITDSLGTVPAKIGIDMSTLVVKIDGIPLPGGWTPQFPHLIAALTHPSTKFAAPSGLNVLADGPHLFEVQIEDLDGNLATSSQLFEVDTIAPIATITSTPAEPAIGFPLASVGTFVGEIAEGSATTGTAIDRLDVYVTNPLGQERVFEVKGALVEKIDAKNWKWRWVVPSPDPYFGIPGFYEFSFRPADVAQNREPSTAANTASILVL